MADPYTFNIYNEKSLDEHKIWTIDRISSKLDFKNDKVIICGDFNAHHNWWNSKINRPTRAENLIKWIQSCKCTLININDEITYIQKSHNGATSVIDLTFATRSVNDSVVNWKIDEEANSGSDHEVISFELITSTSNITNYATTLANKYNLQKAD